MVVGNPWDSTSLTNQLFVIPEEALTGRRKSCLTKSTTKRLRDAQQTKPTALVLRTAELDFENENAGAALSTFLKNQEALILQRLMRMLNITPLNSPLISNSLQE